MSDTPFMPKATAVWLVENTTLTFKQIAEFCNLHELEIKGIADGDVAKGIKAYNPILAGQVSREEIELCSKNPDKKLSLLKKVEEVEVKERKKPKYTPLSKRQDRPDAILWLCKNASELTDGQISKLVGSTKGTVSLIRKRSYWNFSNLKPRDPVILALCTQEAFQKSLEKAKRRVEREKKAKIREEKKAQAASVQTNKVSNDNNHENQLEVFIKIDVKDNNVEQAIRVLKRKLQKEGFFKVMKMKSTYEKPSEKKKGFKQKILKELRNCKNLRIGINFIMRGLTMPSGKVKWFNSKKGYGFITDNETQKDIFLHVSALEKSKLRVLKEEQTIVYDIKEEKDKLQAINIKKK